jgi:hypothetical protein
MGQEVPVEGYSDLLTVAGSSQFPTALTDIDDINGNPAAGAPVSSSVSARKIVQVVYGPQTPQATQPQLDIWAPLLFW